MDAVHLAEIWTYPVKSLRGGPHGAAMVEPWGLAGDRRWLVVDAAGRFMTQREVPRMALVAAVVGDGALVLSAAGAADLRLPVGGAGAPCSVQVWRDRVMAVDCGDGAATWLSAVLGVACRLAYLADTGARTLKPGDAGGASDSVSFADGFPLLLTNAASLDDVNARLAQAVPMTRFRSNLVVSGAAAWAEDGWRLVRVGGAVFRVAKPCERCIMTTLDPLTGMQPDGNEPLVTLGRFRRDGSGRILFGVNLVVERTGVVRVGDGVEVG